MGMHTHAHTTCTHMHTLVETCARPFVSTPEHTCTHMWTQWCSCAQCVQVHTESRAHAHRYTPICEHTGTSTHGCTPAGMHMQTYMGTCAPAHEFAHTLVNAQEHTRALMRTHNHTREHTCTCTHICRNTEHAHTIQSREKEAAPRGRRKSGTMDSGPASSRLRHLCGGPSPPLPTFGRCQSCPYRRKPCFAMKNVSPCTDMFCIRLHEL